MRKLAILLVVFFLAFNIHAEVQPQDRVTEMVQRVKSEKSIQPTLDYIHWETAFKDLKAQEKAMLQVDSPISFKERMSSMIKDPGTFIKEQLRAQMGLQNIPEEQAKMLDGMIDAQITTVKGQMDAEVNKFINSEYKITDTRIEQQKAQVDLEILTGAESKKETLHLQQVDGQWWLALSELQNTLGAKHAEGAAPVSVK